jgi:hypothetical protein
MIVGPPLTKEPGEIIPWSVDFKNVLSSFQGTPTFKAYKKSDNSDATGALQNGAVSTAGTIATVDIKAGTDLTDYVLELKATGSDGRVWEAERELLVRDIPAPVA